MGATYPDDVLRIFRNEYCFRIGATRSSHPNESTREMNERQEGLGKLVVARRDASEMLDAVEEPLHQIANPIDSRPDTVGVYRPTTSGGYALHFRRSFRLSQLFPMSSAERERGAAELSATSLEPPMTWWPG